MCDGEDWKRSRYERIKIVFGHVRVELPFRYPSGDIPKMGVWIDFSEMRAGLETYIQELRTSSVFRIIGLEVVWMVASNVEGKSGECGLSQSRGKNVPRKKEGQMV